MRYYFYLIILIFALYFDLNSIMYVNDNLFLTSQGLSFFIGADFNAQEFISLKNYAEKDLDYGILFLSDINDKFGDLNSLVNYSTQILASLIFGYVFFLFSSFIPLVILNLFLIDLFIRVNGIKIGFVNFIICLPLFILSIFPSKEILWIFGLLLSLNSSDFSKSRILNVILRLLFLLFILIRPFGILIYVVLKYPNRISFLLLSFFCFYYLYFNFENLIYVIAPIPINMFMTVSSSGRDIFYLILFISYFISNIFTIVFLTNYSFSGNIKSLILFLLNLIFSAILGGFETLYRIRLIVSLALIKK